MRNWVGQQLGNYRLIRQLGKGGFGQVYLGEHIYLKTHAAIKLLLEDNGDGTQAEAFQSAFLQEARRIAALKHPHILRVLDFGIETSTPYLVMEYAAHGTLLERHPRSIKVPVDQVVIYTTQIAQALHYAHKARLIHRDVKPANVLLDEQDTVLLSDFGIATIAHHTSSMRTSAYAGTAAYMAPEQLQGKPVPASDQYALAIMVYEWLCGQLPYQGDPIAVGMQHLTAPLPSLRLHNQALSPSIEAIVHQAMAKDPQMRFVTVPNFADALERAAQAPSATTLPTVLPFQQKKTPSQLTPTILAAPARSVLPVFTMPVAGSLPPIRHTTPTARPKRKRSLLLVVVLVLLPLMLIGGIYSAATGPWSWNIGRLWTTQNSGTSHILNSVVWSGSQFVAVGDGGTILTSPDGGTWTAQNSPTTHTFDSVAWSGSQFVAVGDYSSILTSPDGRSWTTQNSGISQHLYSVVWSDSQFVAVGQHGTILTSSDEGRTWIAQNSGISNAGIAQDLHGVAGSGSRLVAVGDGSMILTSSDRGRTWTDQIFNDPSTFGSVAWSGSQFVAVGSGGHYNDFVTSSDGPLQTSPDGNTWTTQNLGNQQALYGVVWSGSQFVAVGNYNVILTSPDGHSWTTQNYNDHDQVLHGVAWSGSHLVAVGDGGTIMTSP